MQRLEKLSLTRFYRNIICNIICKTNTMFLLIEINAIFRG